VLCPECEYNLDIDAEEVDEGEIVSCPECGTDYEVITTHPLELKRLAAEEEDEEEPDEEEEGENGDRS
jgi:alpha-aminoadipate carrier protein LysW